MSLSLRSKAQDMVPDVETLRSEMETLRAQIEKLVGDASSSGGAQVRKFKSKASARANDLMHDGEAILGEVGKELRLVEKHAGKAIHDRPVQSLAVALGVGFALAILLRRI